MKSTYKIVWSDEALNSLRDIIEYLENRWTRKEIENFARLLDKQLELIASNPYLFPKGSQSNSVRKSVLTRQTSIYYSIKGKEVHLISIFDNRRRPKNF
jgi:plasmid stabilization system protein ParE